MLLKPKHFIRGVFLNATFSQDIDVYFCTKNTELSTEVRNETYCGNYYYLSVNSTENLTQKFRGYDYLVIDASKVTQL